MEHSYCLIIMHSNKIFLPYFSQDCYSSLLWKILMCSSDFIVSLFIPAASFSATNKESQPRCSYVYLHFPTSQRQLPPLFMKPQPFKELWAPLNREISGLWDHISMLDLMTAVEPASGSMLVLMTVVAPACYPHHIDAIYSATMVGGWGEGGSDF